MRGKKDAEVRTGCPFLARTRTQRSELLADLLAVRKQRERHPRTALRHLEPSTCIEPVGLVAVAMTPLLHAFTRHDVDQRAVLSMRALLLFVAFTTPPSPPSHVITLAAGNEASARVSRQSALAVQSSKCSARGRENAASPGARERAIPIPLPTSQGCLRSWDGPGACGESVATCSAMAS